MIQLPKISIRYPSPRDISSILLKPNEVYKVMGKSGHGKSNTNGQTSMWRCWVWKN